ncbi:MAG: hypothetical protein GX913_08820 [Clostridiales bacterium]|nr:hypothetical protein [Clostridiales bacterium]
MLKKINSIFFGLFFLIALILEIYVIYKFEGDLFTVIGIGVVVLITGYIFMDTVRSQSQEAINNIKLDLEKSQKEQLELIRKELNQLLDISKASYTATKKNGFILEDEIKAILNNLDSKGQDYISFLTSIEKLQRKSMEGQKNALNLELNQNKESTKQVIEAFKEENGRLERQQEELKKLLAGLEDKKPSETADTMNSNQQLTEEDNIQEIQPIYDDPNKALSADEISSLFESYGI